jgi:hypothetical protein
VIGPLRRAFGLEESRVWSPVHVVLTVAVLVAAAGVAVTWGDIHRYGGTDLRARVVGARMLALGLDPYRPLPGGVRHEWLYHPHWVFREITGCPYPPPLLALYALLCWLPYAAQRVIWFALEWASLLVSIAWLSRCVRPRRIRPWFVALALLFFAGGSFWRLHVERGQYYACVLLLFTWSASALARRGHGDGWRAGLPLGLAAALRPTAIVVVAPLWLLGYRKTAASAVAAAGATALALLPVTGITFWKDYVRLVETFEKAVPGVPEVTSMPHLAWVEGANFTEVMEHRSSNANIHLLLVSLAPRLGGPPLSLVPILAKVGCLAALAVLLALVWRGRRARWRGGPALAVAFTAVLVTEHFLPVRWGYVDTLYLAPLALVMPFMWRRRGRMLLLTVLAALVFGHSLVGPLDGGPGSLVRAVLLTGGLVAWTAAVTRRRPRLRPAA